MYRKRSTITALIMTVTAMATPASAIEWPSTLAGLDRNGDAQVDFTEFSNFTDALGLSRTLAAQHFTRMSAGDALITSQEWFLATQINESKSWKQGYALEPLQDEPTEVGPADIRAYEAIPDEPLDSPAPLGTDEPPNEEEAG